MDSTLSLESLRGEIDRIDSEIHDLLMRRTQVSRAIAKAKGSGAPSFRPAREIQVLRRLLDRHEGPLPRAVLLRIWREILSDSLAQQGSFSVAAWVPEAGPSLVGVARDHFGVLTPVLERQSPSRVFNSVAEGECALGLLPPPEADSPEAWWRFLARRGEKVPRIIGRLPLAPAASPSSGGHDALIIGLIEPEPSGADHSYVVLEAEAQFSRSAAKALIEKADLPVYDIIQWGSVDEGHLLLIEVADFVAQDDPRLTLLRDMNNEHFSGGWLIGAYPLPFNEPDLADPRAAAKERERI